jgi:hypothetical protein
MRKTMKTAVLAAALLAASGATTRAQDDVSQEAGPVEMAPSTQVQATTNTEAAAAPVPTAGALRVYGGLRIGVGGGIKPVAPEPPPPGHNDLILTAPATPGIQIGAEYLLMKYFALGVETRLNWARPRSGEDRFMLWDLVVKPRANYQLGSMPVELYAALPVGLSIANMPEDIETGKAGATLGLSGGANYFFTNHFGLNVEMGWLWHWVRVEVEDSTETARLGQLTLISANFMYAF